MFYERKGKQIVRVEKTLTVKDLLARGSQVFVTHHRYSKDLDQWRQGQLSPKPSPYNYLVRVR